jgi:hypothetical protein
VASVDSSSMLLTDPSGGCPTGKGGLRGPSVRPVKRLSALPTGLSRRSVNEASLCRLSRGLSPVVTGLFPVVTGVFPPGAARLSARSSSKPRLSGASARFQRIFGLRQDSLPDRLRGEVLGRAVHGGKRGQGSLAGTGCRDGEPGYTPAGFPAGDFPGVHSRSHPR